MLKDHYGINPDWYQETITGPWESIDNEQFRTVEEDGVLYIFFEKTVGWKDWGSNLNFLPIEAKGAVPVKAYPQMDHPWYCHRGFKLAWNKVEKEIMYRVNSFGNTSTGHTVRIQGYSRGAALAQKCNESIEWGWDTVAVETLAFASPRWIWRPYSENVKPRMKGVKIILDDGDLVGHYPPWWTGYAHVGEKVIVSSRNYLFASPMEHTEDNYWRALVRYVSENHKTRV